MNIEEQKGIADEIYTKLKVIDPYCILAGGAPRDWYFGNTANDLDFYFHSGGSTITATKSQLGFFFPEVTLLMHNDSSAFKNGQDERYKTMPFLRRIWEMHYKGVKVQLIQLSENLKQFKVVDFMDVSICQCSYLNGQIRMHDNFKKTLVSGIMFLTSEGYNWSDRHGVKMAERFKNKFSLGTEEQANNRILKNAVREIT